PAASFLVGDRHRAVRTLGAFFCLLHDAIGDAARADAEQELAPMTGAPALGVGVSCCAAGSLDQSIALVRERLEELYAGRLELPQRSVRNPQQHVLAAMQHIV